MVAHVLCCPAVTTTEWHSCKMASEIPDNFSTSSARMTLFHLT
jgi:hypothetical protein